MFLCLKNYSRLLIKLQTYHQFNFWILDWAQYFKANYHDQSFYWLLTSLNSLMIMVIPINLIFLFPSKFQMTSFLLLTCVFYILVFFNQLFNFHLFCTTIQLFFRTIQILIVLHYRMVSNYEPFSRLSQFN